jgi:hypothetical protein
MRRFVLRDVGREDTMSKTSEAKDWCCICSVAKNRCRDGKGTHRGGPDDSFDRLGLYAVLVLAVRHHNSADIDFDSWRRKSGRREVEAGGKAREQGREGIPACNMRKKMLRTKEGKVT